MAKRTERKKSPTRMVEYIGPRSRISRPLRPTEYVGPGVSVEVPADLPLGGHWRDVVATSSEAAPKKEDDR